MNVTAMTQNRKRCRNLHEEDSSDFMPLSKRINNLHINNQLQINPNTSLTPEWGRPGPLTEPYKSPETPENLASPNWNQEPPQYNPELNATQNPYYYNNKLLFDLYVERMQRNGQTFN